MTDQADLDRAFLMGFAVSDENFNADNQWYDDFNEVFDAYRRGELVAWLERRKWDNSLAFLREALSRSTRESSDPDEINRKLTASRDKRFGETGGGGR